MRILVAEDDATSRLLMQALLAKWGYKDAIFVEDGQAAWEILQREDRPTVAILDWMMPHLAGIEVCRKLRALKCEPAPYVMLLTAKSQKEDIAQGLDAGADDYLIKPFDFMEFSARLRVAARQVALQRELIASREIIAKQARYDMTSGALNRAAIGSEARKALGRGTGIVGVLLVALDDHRQVQQSDGVEAADALAKSIVERILEQNPGLLIGRYDADELMIVLPDTHATEATSLAQRICDAFAGVPIDVDGTITDTTVSCGLTLASAAHHDDLAWVSCSADAALATARMVGNAVEVLSLGETDEEEPAPSGSEQAEALKCTG